MNIERVSLINPSLTSTLVVEDTSLLCSEVTGRKNSQESQREYPIISSSHSEISLNEFRLKDIISIRTLVDSLSESSIVLTNSAFDSICIPIGENTFIASGEVEKSEINNVAFSNITLEHADDNGGGGISTTLASTLECIMNSVSVSRSEDTFYGVLCSGLTEKTKGSFMCTNSTFSECVRKRTRSFHHHDVINNNTISFNQNNPNSKHNTTNHSLFPSLHTNTTCSDTEWTSCMVSDRKDFTQNANFQFRYCIFPV